MLETIAATSDRKLRLFSVACLQNTFAGAEELIAAEQYIEGKLTFDKLQQAFDYRDLIEGEGLSLLAHPVPMPACVVAQLAAIAAAQAGHATTTYAPFKAAFSETSSDPIHSAPYPSN